MDNLRILFNFCADVMRINIPIWGYNFNLFAVVAFVFAASLILFILFKILF